MTKKRNLSDEISEIRNRHRFNDFHAESSLRMDSIESAFKHLPETLDNEMLRYFPVAAVACLERHTRFMVQAIVDAGEPYLTNAEALVTKSGGDFSILRAVHGKKITVGEFVAHGLQLSKIEHIDEAISTLTRIKFLHILKTVADRWEHEVLKKTKIPIIADPARTYRHIQKAFELRHIICHEMASNVSISHDDVDNIICACSLFIKASREFTYNLLHPNSPLTQTDMNIASAKDYDRSRKEQELVIAKILPMLTDELKDSFNNAQAQWEAYRDAWAEHEADHYRGGSIYPTIYNGVGQSVTKKRTEELLSFLEMLSHYR